MCVLIVFDYVAIGLLIILIGVERISEIGIGNVFIELFCIDQYMKSLRKGKFSEYWNWECELFNAKMLEWYKDDTMKLYEGWIIVI